MAKVGRKTLLTEEMIQKIVDATMWGNYAVTICDYVGITNALATFTNGQTAFTYTVSIIDNLIVDGNRTVNLYLTNPVGKAVIGAGTGTLTIVDNEFAPGVLQFNPTNYSVAEAGTNVTLTVSRQGTGWLRRTVESLGLAAPRRAERRHGYEPRGRPRARRAPGLSAPLAAARAAAERAAP